MKQFYETYKDFPKLSTALRESNHILTNAFKDSYVFEFLNLPVSHSEGDLQCGLAFLSDKKLLQQKLHELFDNETDNK